MFEACDRGGAQGEFLDNLAAESTARGVVCGQQDDAPDYGLLVGWNSRKLTTTGSRPLSRCRAALSASPIAPCSPPSCLLPRRAAQGAGCRPDVAPGPPSPPGCPAGRKPGGSTGSSGVCNESRSCASSGRSCRSTAPSSKSLPTARERQKNCPQPLGRSRGGWPTTMHLVAADARPALVCSRSPGPAAPRSSRGAEGPGLRGRLAAAPGRGTGVCARGAAATEPGETLGICP